MRRAQTMPLTAARGRPAYFSRKASAPRGAANRHSAAISSRRSASIQATTRWGCTPSSCATLRSKAVPRTTCCGFSSEDSLRPSKKRWTSRSMRTAPRRNGMRISVRSRMRGSLRMRTEMSLSALRTANTVYLPTSSRTPSATGVPLKRLSFAMPSPPWNSEFAINIGKRKADRAHLPVC